uniref:TATA-box-binding protein n=1 Tax=Tetranychus urticae TaxID=32264 RepID=A0A158P536_TETUR
MRYLQENIKVVNVVTSFELNSNLCRNQIKDTFQDIEYKKTFPGGVLKYPDGCLLVFDSGKIIVTGVQNIATAIVLIDRFCAKYPRDIKYTSFKIVNITACTKIIGDFDYNELLLHPKSSYTPELFPGIHLKLDDTKVIFIIFRTGKVIITGLKDYKSIFHYCDEFDYNIRLKSI